MSDSTSRLYNIAIEKGLSDGMICGFPADLIVYKPIYCGSKSLHDIANQEED